MSFQEFMENADWNAVETALAAAGPDDVMRALVAETLTKDDFLALLSPAALPFLESMAQRAKRSTEMQFGKVLFLFTPLYLANYCVNQCVYCGFNTKNHIARGKLSMDEVRREAEAIAARGHRSILILTGESRNHTPPSYIAACSRELQKYFRSISMEVYPMSHDDYAMLADTGVDGVTLYQETYEPLLYDRLHVSGPKKDYAWRLNAPERALKAGIRNVNIGALLGLNHHRPEVFFTGMHLAWLQQQFPAAEVGMGFPRMRPHAGDQREYPGVTDKELIQAILAIRLFLPRAGITISTRERPWLRDHLVGLGVTRMSAGASTEVGGYAEQGKTESQFQISDERSVPEMLEMIRNKGYQPVFKDWDTTFDLWAEKAEKC